jgi:cell division protein ZapA (FtsZ GTPase activity inhibitor)
MYWVVAKVKTMSDSTNNITVIIAGRPYPLKIKEGDEPIIRRIVKEVNDKIALFQNTYPRKDRQDWLSMALLTSAVDLHKAQATIAQPAPVAETATDPQLAERLSHLDSILSLLVN